LAEKDVKIVSKVPQTTTENDIEKDTEVITNQPIIPTTTTTTAPTTTMTTIPTTTTTIADDITTLKPIFKVIADKKQKEPDLKDKPNIWKKIANENRNKHRPDSNVPRIRNYRDKCFPSRNYLTYYRYYYPLHRNHNLIYVPTYKTYVYYVYYYIPLYVIRRYWIHPLEHNNYHVINHGLRRNNFNQFSIQRY